MVWDSFLRNFHGFSSILFSSRLVSSLCTPNLLSHQEHHGRCSWSLPWDSEGREIHPMGVSKNRDTPKRMVYFRENPIFKWMIWGETPVFSETSMWGFYSCFLFKIFTGNCEFFPTIMEHVFLSFGGHWIIIFCQDFAELYSKKQNNYTIASQVCLKMFKL